MRKSRVLALISASALAAVSRFASADTPLFSTRADWGGSQFAPNPPPAGEPQQAGNQGMGYYNGTSILPFTNNNFENVEYTTFSTSGSTKNGAANFDNTFSDSSVGTSWTGLTSPTGSLTIDNYQGGYDAVVSGEEAPANSQNTAFLTALAKGTVLAIDYTTPLGGATLSANTTGGTFADYYNLGFGSYGPAGDTLTPTQAASSDQFPTKRDVNMYGVTVGSFVVNHGTYLTAYIPYDGSPINNIIGNNSAYMQFFIYINSNQNTYGNLNPGNIQGANQVGNVTLDNVRTVSPTWATAGNGSWTASDPATGSWIGGSLPGGVLGGASGGSATLGDLETGNTSASLDMTWTLGTLNINTTQWQYSITPGTNGSLVMDNSTNSAPAQINDFAGGSAATNYTEFLAAPITLNSNTVVTVTRATDTLQIGGAANPLVSGTGSLTVAGSGTLLLYGPNTYSGGTIVNPGAHLLAGSDSSLPANSALTNNGNATLAGSATLSSLSGTGILTVGNGSESNTVTLAVNSGQATQGGLVIAANSALDISNNHILITYGSGADPIGSIAALLQTGYNGGAWNGRGGIISSTAAANAGSYGVGYADSADPGNPAGLASGTIEIAFTLLGDADLNHIVNGIDFGIVAANFNKGVTSWDQGDFDYNHIVNGIDFGDVAANFNKGASGADAWSALVQFAEANGLMADVPEPATIGLMAVGAAGLMTRRRNRRA